MKQNELFSFLFDFEFIKQNSTNGELMKSCKTLENSLEHIGNSDLNAGELHNELFIIANMIEKYEIEHPIDILNTIKKLDVENSVPNAVIAYRIWLTSPITVAHGERSFSKLKIIKNYMRSTMSQDRLNGLAMISIEHGLADSLNSIKSLMILQQKKHDEVNFKFTFIFIYYYFTISISIINIVF